MRKPYCKCIDCGTPVWTKGGRCRECYNIYIIKYPEKHSTFKDGRKNNNKCIDCSKKICYGNLRCNKCHLSYVKKNHLNAGKNNSQWKGGLPKCKICGKGLKNYSATYRNKCFWKVPEIKARILKLQRKAMNLSPNKPETCLIKLLNKLLPKIYKFVGDGKLIVGGFIPDFVNKDNNKIIELFGCYWHK